MDSSHPTWRARGNRQKYDDSRNSRGYYRDRRRSAVS